MSFLQTFFGTAPQKSQKELLADKTRLETMRNYLSQKIEYLDSKRIDPHLVVLTCQDAPVEKTGLGTPAGLRGYIKQCLKHYKKKLTETEQELKKVHAALK